MHRERPFFKDLVAYMTSGPVIVQVLEGENAVRRTATSWARPIRRRRPRAPSAPTSRTSIEQNVVHGSDSLENAAREIAYFFAETELCPR